jgi:hypothetical protein
MFPSCSDVLRITRNKTMLERFFETDSDKTLFAQRIVLGGVMLPHGAQKLLGWFGPCPISRARCTSPPYWRSWSS